VPRPPVPAQGTDVDQRRIYPLAVPPGSELSGGGRPQWRIEGGLGPPFEQFGRQVPAGQHLEERSAATEASEAAGCRQGIDDPRRHQRVHHGDVVVGGHRSEALPADPQVAIGPQGSAQRPVPAQRHRRRLVAQPRRQRPSGHGAQPRQPSQLGVLAAAMDDAAKRWRRAGHAHDEQVATPHGAAAGQHPLGVGGVGAQAELVATETGDHGPARRPGHDRLVEMGVERPQQAMASQQPGGHRAEGVEQVASDLDPLPVGEPKAGDDQLLPLALFGAGVAEHQRGRDG